MASASAVDMGPCVGEQGLPGDDPLRALPQEELGQPLDDLIESWPSDGISDHLSLELAAVHRRGRPLDVGAPVPGCVCPDCTGIPDEVPAWTLRTPAYAREMERWASWGTRVDQARAVSIVEVAARLGCGEPKKQGRELVTGCPLHEDSDPSLRMDVNRGVWFCDPCGEGGDGIRLYLRARRVDFKTAVKELAGGMAA